MDVVCDRCGWRIRPGMFIEANVTPDLLAALPTEWTMGYLEAEHFLESDCRGSIIHAPQPQPVERHGWVLMPRTAQFRRVSDGFTVACEHVAAFGFPPS